MPLLLAALLSVTLSPPFGEASARLIGFTPDEVTIELTVEVSETAAIVLMRGVDVAGNEIDPVALTVREDGTWGAVVELPARRDIRLAFEMIPERGQSTLSDAASLIDLGIPRERLTAGLPPPTSPVEDTGVVGLPWIILAATTALAALVLLAIWSRSGKDQPASNSGETE